MSEPSEKSAPMPKFDPNDFGSIQDARSSKEAAQWWFLFACIVAGKTAEFATTALKNYLARNLVNGFPFEAVRYDISVGMLRERLENARTGNYTKLAAAFRYMIKCTIPAYGDDPRVWTVEQMMLIHGVGPKTARWFRLLVEPTAPVAALDTHVLKFLADCDLPGLIVPKSTPSEGQRYRDLEGAFVYRAKKLGMTPRDLDYFVWALYRKGGRITGL